MHQVYYHAVFLAVISNYFDIFTTATFYEEKDIKITQESVIKRWSGVSRSTCALRCRRHEQCYHAAIEGNDCLLLKNGSFSPSSEGDQSEEGRMLPVTILKEIDTERKPNITTGKIIIFSKTTKRNVFTLSTNYLLV